MTGWNEALAAAGGAARLSLQCLLRSAIGLTGWARSDGWGGRFTLPCRVVEKPTLHQGVEREERKKEKQRCSHSCLDGGLNGSLERRRGKNARHMWRYALPHKRTLTSYGTAQQIAPAVGRRMGNEMKCKQQMASFFWRVFSFSEPAEQKHSYSLAKGSSAHAITSRQDLLLAFPSGSCCPTEIVSQHPHTGGSKASFMPLCSGDAVATMSMQNPTGTLRRFLTENKSWLHIALTCHDMNIEKGAWTPWVYFGALSLFQL